MAEQGFTPPTSEWYRPAADMIKQANVPDYDAVYELARQDPQAFWAKRAEELEWYKKWDQVLDEGNKPFLPVVRRRQDQYGAQRARPAREDLAAQQTGDHLGGRGRRKDHAVLLALVAGDQQIRQCASRDGRQERRPRHDLYGTRARDRHRHAGLRQDRRAPQRCLWRLLRAGAGEPH